MATLKHKISIKEAEDLFYKIALKEENKENFTPEYQEQIKDLIRTIRELKVE